MDGDTLVGILRAYDASVDAAAVRAALSGPDSAALARWAELHLTPDTLLTTHELSQYAALEESGLAERFASLPDLASAHVLTDADLRDAIDQLNRSTQAITQHTESLRQQQDALGRLVAARRQGNDDRLAVEAAHARRWQDQRRDLASGADELLHSLRSRVNDLEQQSTGSSATIQQTVDSLFSSDDKLLSSLQKLGWELETEDPAEQNDVAMLREACARLIKFTVEGIRTKLDRIYLESLEASAQSVSASRVSPSEVSSLQEELESLYAEILPVAQMSVEQQFLEPALKSRVARNGQVLARSAQATNYIHDCLDYLIDRAQDLAARLNAFQAYQLAANAVVEIATTELGTQASTVEASPTRRPNPQQLDVSPVRPRPKQRSRYSSGAELAQEPPLEEILRLLAISLPQAEDDESPNLPALAKQLSSTLAIRRAKAHDVARNVQETFEHAATKQVADGNLAIQLVRDSVLAESPFGEVLLVDPEIEGSIAVLVQELVGVEGKLRGVEAGVGRLRGRSAKREEIVGRWGS
ncbi:hypothetical protein C8A05DRAFT_15101 [Staphylotrichum tortipilum]|uniref:Uncharacterized protein n=1 Tax=Staphylotrichum tortipilum TaxID=2831512 RepID=A0AAN6MMY4_9PEZI|nr:hypothetical protein C8A05DRAFT_15101 [Staphylotrichum longicolle]